MKIVLVGSILRHTVHSDAGTYSGWGGMTESAVAPFAALLDKNSKLYFIGSVGKEDIEEVREFYKKNYPFVDASGIHINSTGTDHHEGNKHFVTRKIQVEPTRYKHIKPYIYDADVVIFNFGNIDDIDPDAIREVKQNSNALVYVDVHRKPFGADKQGRMYTRGWPDWHKYLRYADVVQMDRSECEALFGKKIKTISDAVAAARKILEAGAGQAIITLGSKGSLVGHRSPAYRYFHAPVVRCQPVDTTGCGDAFAAGYLVSWHEGGMLHNNVAWGSLLAAVNTEFMGYMKNINRRKLAQRLPDTFKMISVDLQTKTVV